MHERSVSHAIIKNQDIDNDPWNLGVHFTKGLVMSKEKRLSNFAEELVATNARLSCDQYYLSFDSLSDDDKNELARLYIDASDRDLSECLYGDDLSIDNEYTCALMSMLKDKSQESIEKFAEVTRNNIIKYYEETLQAIIDDACDTYLRNINEANGYHSHIDQEHGDVYWGKFA